MNPRYRFGKSARNRRIFGVCGGMGQFFGIDARIFRAIWLVAALLTRGMAGWVYLVLGLALPYAGQTEDGDGVRGWVRQNTRAYRNPLDPPPPENWKQDAQDTDYRPGV